VGADTALSAPNEHDPTSEVSFAALRTLEQKRTPVAAPRPPGRAPMNVRRGSLPLSSKSYRRPALLACEPSQPGSMLAAFAHLRRWRVAGRDSGGGLFG
jgi:hypothetical protein